MAKFAALLGFACIFILGTTLPPSIMLPAVMDGRYLQDGALNIPAQVPVMRASIHLFNSQLASVHESVSGLGRRGSKMVPPL
ncbi:MAG: hypothetical protein ACR2NN_20740 [Bryobacteraceae bacterium]